MTRSLVYKVHASSRIPHSAMMCAVACCVAASSAAHASSYELIPDGLRRGSLNLQVKQAGATSTQSPVIESIGPQFPDPSWTGPLIALGGAAPFANVTASGEARYWFSATTDSLSIQTRSLAARTLSGGINTSSSASASTVCIVPFRLDAQRSVRVHLEVERVGGVNAGSFTATLQTLTGAGLGVSLDTPGTFDIQMTLDPGSYRIFAGTTATPAQNASAATSVVVTITGLSDACTADFNGDGFLDFTDFDDFVVAFESGLAAGDFNADGFLDFTDFDAFVNAFEAGC